LASDIACGGKNHARPRTGFSGARTQNFPEEAAIGPSDGPFETYANQKVEWRAIGELQPYRRNARKHSAKQITQIAASIRRFGFINPILIDDTDQIMAGHGRVDAAKEIGLERVPTLRVNHLSEAEKRAYILADNRLAELAGWDRETLAIELEGLLELDLDFEVEITGFDTVDIDLIVGAGEEAGFDPADEIPEIDRKVAAVSRLGDLWRLGNHRLLCGDALDPAAYERLLDGVQAHMVFTDPPYNVPIDGHVCGTGRIRHHDFVMASGEMSSEEFTAFLTRVFRNLTRATVDGSIHFVFMDWRHAYEILEAGGQSYTEFKNLCVWNKDNAGMGSFYRSKHELVFVFKNGKAHHVNNFGLGEGGRYRSNVWDYPGINTLRRDRIDELAMHPTVKPVALVADAIRDCSRRKGIILDPFAGSGTTIIAAEKTGRAARAMELDPMYVDVVIRRWQERFAKSAVHVESGKNFAQIQAERRSTMSVRRRQPPRGKES
jgi:DNA modification methylase